MVGRGGPMEDTEVRWSSSLHVEPVYRGQEYTGFMRHVLFLVQSLFKWRKRYFYVFKSILLSEEKKLMVKIITNWE